MGLHILYLADKRALEEVVGYLQLDVEEVIEARTPISRS